MVIDELQKATRYTNLGVCGRPARGSCLIFTTVAVLKNTSDGSLYKSRCVCVYVRFLPGIHSGGLSLQLDSLYTPGEWCT